MSATRRLPLTAAFALLLAVAGAIVYASAGGVGATPRDHRTQSEGESVAASLVGTWTGTKSGAEGGSFESREWRVVFKQAQEAAAFGTKQYRQPNGRFSKAEVVNAVVDSTGHIWASDADGVLNGSLSEDGTLELIYQEPGTKDGAAVIALLRREP